MRTLNLGILAHVDAGKTTLTERLLFAAGAIRDIGSVDQGTTQTDTLELERERGITIKSAVASFGIDDLTVNIVDTPGHPDFIAEVERVLRVLDGAILVVSAVEGIQPQTPLLFRALARLGVPTLLFVNKIDRRGADPDRVLEAISARLTPAIVPLAEAIDPGTPDARVRALTDERRDRGMLAERLAERDEGVLTTWVERGDVPYPQLRASLARQARAGAAHPVFLGSAITGSGVEAVLKGISDLLPVASGDPEREVAARAFKIERGASGDRVAYLRLFDGTIRVRDRIAYGGGEGRITSLAVFGPGGAVQSVSAGPGQVARVTGLAGIRVGDAVGALPVAADERQFPPPALEAVVVPRRAAARGRLRAALNELAEYDPLINVRQDDDRGEIAVSLYGEVQKDVIAETLARDHGVEVEFRETTTICIERPAGVAEVLEVLRSPTKTNISGKSSPDSDNPYAATLGLRLEPAAVGSGVDVRLDVDVQLIPMYVFNTVTSFLEHIASYVRAALGEGRFGWQVTDCVVTVFDSGYFRTGSTAGDFRKLTSLVLSKALDAAGTIVCEPMTSVRIDAPVASGSGIVHVLLTTGSRILGQFSATERTTITALVQAARVHEIQNRLPGLTGGEGVLEASFGGYHPVIVDPPPARRPSAEQLVANGGHR